MDKISEVIKDELKEHATEDLEEVIPTLEDLKNPDHVDCQDDNEEEEMTASQYKKSLKKKVSQFTEEEKQKYNALSQKKKRKKDKIIEEQEISEKAEKEELQIKQTLYNQLYCLKEKFPDNTKNIIIDVDMSLEVLEEKKKLILTIITQKNADRVVFQSLLLMCRTGERGLNYFDIDMLDGFSEEVENCSDDVIPILKEMIDMGQIDTSFLTPELRLLVVMSGCAVRTMEKNNAKKKVCDINVEQED